MPIRFVPVCLLLFAAAARAQAPQDLPRDTVAWTAQPLAQATGRASLTLSGKVTPGWHVYALKQLPEGPTPLVVTVAANDVANADGSPTGSAPSKVHDPAFDLDTQFYAGAFTLTIPVRFKPHAGSGAIPVDVRFQTCNGRVCQPPKTVRLSVPVTLVEK